MTLSGGCLEMYKVLPGAGTEIFHFDGGTLIPKDGAFTVNGVVAPGTTNGTGMLTVQGDLTVNDQTAITVSGNGETAAR